MPRHPLDLTQLQREFLDASLAAEQAEQRKETRRRRKLKILAASMAFLATVSFYFFWDSKQKASDLAAALKVAQRNESRTLTAFAEQEITRLNYTTARNLASAALPISLVTQTVPSFRRHLPHFTGLFITVASSPSSKATRARSGPRSSIPQARVEGEARGEVRSGPWRTGAGTAAAARTAAGRDRAELVDGAARRSLSGDARRLVRRRTPSPPRSAIYAASTIRGS